MRRTIKNGALSVVMFGVTSIATAQTVELVPSIGYRFGGSVYDYGSVRSLDVRDSEAYGLTVGFDLGVDNQVFVRWMRQDTEVDDYRGPQDQRFGLAIEHWHVGGMHNFDPFDTVQPFVEGMLGLTYMNPDPRDIRSSSRFSAGLGGGIRIMPSDRIGLRLGARTVWTAVNSGGGVFCGPWGCSLGFSGSGFWQIEGEIGLVVRF
jgi:hypothetical protein